jgi:hypothetical protein
MHMEGGDSTETPAASSIPTGVTIVRRPAFTFRNLVLVAGGVSGAVFLLGYVVAVSEGLGDDYLRAFSVQFVVLGLFGGLVALSWTAKYHLRVWERVQICFDVGGRAYRDVVDPLLEQAYSVRRIGIEFLAGLSLVVVWNVILLKPIPYAIWFEGYDPYANVVFEFWLSIDALTVINYLYGFVALFVIVAGTHGVVHFLRLVRRVTDLPLSDVETAAERLEPIARFSIFVATTTFVGVLLLLVVYARLVTVADGDLVEITEFVAQYAFFILVILTGCIVVGMAMFWIPQMAIHDAISAAKQDRLVAIDDEYERLLETSRSEARSPDHLATQLEIVEARRRNAKEIDTWSYNLPTLLPFVGSGIATTITWLLSVTGDLSRLLF